MEICGSSYLLFSECNWNCAPVMFRGPLKVEDIVCSQFSSGDFWIPWKAENWNFWNLAKNEKCWFFAFLRGPPEGQGCPYMAFLALQNITRAQLSYLLVLPVNIQEMKVKRSYLMWQDLDIGMLSHCLVPKDLFKGNFWWLYLRLCEQRALPLLSQNLSTQLDIVLEMQSTHSDAAMGQWQTLLFQ